MGKVALQGQLESRGWEMGKQEQKIVACAEMRQLEILFIYKHC